MPTVNQLLKKPRTSGRKKAKAPALRFRYNTAKKMTNDKFGSPQKRRVSSS